MPLPQTGVEYIGKGFDRWIRDLAKSVKAISEHEKFTRNDALALSMLTDAANKAVAAQNKLASGYLKSNQVATTSIKEKQKVHEQSIQEAINSMSEEMNFQIKFTQKTISEAGKRADAEEKATQRAASALKANQALSFSNLSAIGGNLGGIASGMGLNVNLGSLGAIAGIARNAMAAIAGLTAILTGLGFAAGTAATGAGILVGGFIALVGAAITAKNALDFIKKAAAAVGDILKTAFNFAVNTAINVVRGSLQLLGSVINALLSPVRWLGEQVRQVFVVTIGVLLRDAVRGAMQAIQDLIGMIFEGGTSMQILQIRLQGMLATEIQSTHTTLTFADAMKSAVGPTKDLIDWINVLAVKSPFERGTIADTVSLGMALDFTSEQAKKITSALVDWASGMGLEGDAITRILYNFGQMRAQGKLTGQELRDAARGGLIPVMDILRDMGTELGYTGAKLEKFIHNAASSGADVDTFFAKFIDLAEKRFPNAAERMSRTWAGVTNNMKDFIKTVLGADVLTPVLDKIAGKMADFLNQMLTPEVRNQFKAIGEGLSYAFDVIYPAIQRAIASVQEFAKSLGLPEINAFSLAATIEIVADKIAEWLGVAADKVRDFSYSAGDHFQRFSENALTYGTNTAIQWANGFIQGVETAVLGAIQALNNLLSTWLAPGSPPKVAPQIGNWGARTFEEYLKGFKDADFSVLDTVGDAINSSLNALVGLGKLDKNAVGGIYGGLLKGLAKGISGGGFSESFLKKLKNQLGEFGGAVVKLLKDQMAYAQATNAAAAAEKALADAQKASSAQRVKVNGLIKDYNTALRGGASRDQLGQKLAIINAEEKTLKVQQDQVIIAQKAAEDAKAKADALKETAALQDKLVSELVKLGGAYAITIDTTQATGALGGVSKALADVGTGADLLSQKLEERVLNSQKQTKSIGTSIAEAKKSLLTTFDEMGVAFTTFTNANFNTDDPTTNAGKIKNAFINLGHIIETFYNETFNINNPDSSLAKIYLEWVKFQIKLDETEKWFGLFATVLSTSLTLAFLVLQIVLAPIINAFQGLLNLVSAIQAIIEWIIGHPVSSPGGYGFASGGPVTGGKSVLVGEKGREIYTPAQNGFIIPNRITEAIMSRSSAGRVSAPMMSSGKTVNIVFENVAINNGMDLAQLEAVIQKTVVKGLS